MGCVRNLGGARKTYNTNSAHIKLQFKKATFSFQLPPAPPVPVAQKFNMFSSSQRVQNVFGLYTTVILVVSALISIISYTGLYTSGAFSLTPNLSNIETKSTLKFTRRSGAVNGKGKENTRITFDLDADLRPLFNWNTKQVFVYLEAEYDGGKNRPDISNTIAFWDKIITSKEKAVLSLKNQRGHYSVYDVQKSFNNNNATLRLGYNIQPWVGALIFGHFDITGDSQFTFPSPY